MKHQHKWFINYSSLPFHSIPALTVEEKEEEEEKKEEEKEDQALLDPRDFAEILERLAFCWWDQ